MKVKVQRTWKGMPEGAQIGDEIDLDDDEFTEQRRLGNVERAQAQQGKQPQNATAGDRPQANQGDNQNRSPTAVEPMTTDRYSGQGNQSNK